MSVGGKAQPVRPAPGWTEGSGTSPHSACAGTGSGSPLFNPRFPGGPCSHWASPSAGTPNPTETRGDAPATEPWGPQTPRILKYLLCKKRNRLFSSRRQFPVTKWHWADTVPAKLPSATAFPVSPHGCHLEHHLGHHPEQPAQDRDSIPGGLRVSPSSQHSPSHPLCGHSPVLG